MQVEREAALRGGGKWRTGEQHVGNLPQGPGQPTERWANTGLDHGGFGPSGKSWPLHAS